MGRLPVLIGRFINRAYIIGAVDARLSAASLTLFIIPDYNTEKITAYILEKYY